MSVLYGRKYNVIVGDRIFNSDQFTIYFDVPFDDGADTNIAEIEIYNLKDTTINNIKNGQKVILNAGYQNDVGAILIGTLRQPSTDWSGVDRITTLNVLDTNDAWMEKDVNKTYKENSTGKQILTDLLKLTGLQTGSLEIPLDMVYTGAKTIKGKLGPSIVEVAQDCNAKIHVNRGKIFIRAKAKGDNIGFILDKEHGLIGSPTPIEKKEDYNVATKTKGEYEQKSQTRKGFKVLSLLHHKITTDSVIQLKSKTANGLFRVESGRHYCDGNSYYTEMEVFPA